MAGDIAQKLRELLTADVQAAGFDLEDVAVNRAGSRSVVRIVVDRDGGLDLDAVADVSRAISEVLDGHDGVLPGAYSLEVTSPGVDRPLTEPRHWRRNLGRLVIVTRAGTPDLTGRVTAADDRSVTVDGTVIPLAEVGRGMVQVEFNRPTGTPGYDESVALDDTVHDDAEEDDA